jgi:hypothetical protein
VSQSEEPQVGGPEYDVFFRQEEEFLRLLLPMIDSHISDIRKWEEDHDGTGYYDRLVCQNIGLGLAGLQQYLVSVHSWWNIPRSDALGLGPQFRDGRSVAAVVDLLANCWKHQAEWAGGEEGGPAARKTREGIRSIGGDPDDSCVIDDRLVAMQGSVSLMRLFESLLKWKTAVAAMSQTTGAFLKGGGFKASVEKGA